jgi:GT2 family glycosyltransferase
MSVQRNCELGPKVTVIIATFNRAKFLERCVRSVLDQTYRNVECIVVDGASQDGSLGILERLASSDSRLRFLSEPDEGEVYAANNGISLASGEIMGFQASDDYYVPDAVETAVAFLLQNPQFVCVGGDARFIDEHGADLGYGMFTYRGEMSQGTVRTIIMRHHVSPVYHGSVFGWRQRMMRHGTFNPAFSVTADYEFYLRLLREGERIGCLPRVQLYYTLHSDMGAIKYRDKVKEQARLIYAHNGLTPWQDFGRLVLSRPVSYFSNPYRPPFFAALMRELPNWTSEAYRQVARMWSRNDKAD